MQCFTKPVINQYKKNFRKFLFKRVFFSLLLLTVFVVSSLAQFKFDKTKRELEVRNLYTIIETKNGDIFAGTWGVGIWKSTDIGVKVKWTPANQLDEKAKYKNIIINDNYIYVTTDDGKIYKSSNNGVTWSQTGKIDEPLLTMPIVISGNKMLVGAETGLFITENEGKSWTKSNNEINETIKDISLINETLYITTLSKGLC